MAIARSRVTAQGQVLIPIEVRRKLGIGPGTMLEWEEEGDKIVIQRAGKYTFEDIHKRIFGTKPPAGHTVAEMKEGVRQYVRKRYARH